MGMSSKSETWGKPTGVIRWTLPQLVVAAVTGWWQATSCSSSIETSGGATSAQMLVALGHRVRNRHPLGGLSGEGTSPDSSRPEVSRALSPTVGAESNRILVYGCAGAS